MPILARPILLAVLVLSGCQMAPTDPLGQVPRLSDVAPSDADSAALAGTEQSSGAGLLGGFFNTLTAGLPEAAPRGDGPDSADVAAATQQPMGVISRSCGVSGGALGTRIATASGYTLYDTIPNSTAPRPHYVTGFADGCARQFSTALATFGDIGTHELVRYAQTRVDLDYSATDQAYEGIKASFCRAGFGRPCGGRLDALARRTTFLSAYHSFGGAGEWAEFLLSDGAVIAAAIESP